ncbi:hypothetical protein GCM10020000_75070 [Streptomyces olivoverticillatus]
MSEGGNFAPLIGAWADRIFVRYTLFSRSSDDRREMNLKNSVACALAACCLTAFGVTGMAGGTAQAAAFTAGHDGNATAQLSLQQLTDKVSARIKHDYPNAKLMLADGSSPSGPTKDMSKVTAWRFVFNTPDGPSGVKSVEVPADLSGKIGGIVKHPSPWGGVYAIDKRTPLTPAEAYDILRRAQPRPGVSIRLARQTPGLQGSPAVPLLRQARRLQRIRGERRRPRRQPHLRLTTRPHRHVGPPAHQHTRSRHRSAWPGDRSPARRRPGPLCTEPTWYEADPVRPTDRVHQLDAPPIAPSARRAKTPPQPRAAQDVHSGDFFGVSHGDQPGLPPPRPVI